MTTPDNPPTRSSLGAGELDERARDVLKKDERVCRALLPFLLDKAYGDIPSGLLTELSIASYLAALRPAPAPSDETLGRPDPLFDDDAMWSVINEVFCRVYGDDYEAMREAWREWYQPESWLWWGRALGAFMSTHPARPAPAREGEAGSWNPTATELNAIYEEASGTRHHRSPEGHKWHEAGLVAVWRAALAHPTPPAPSPRMDDGTGLSEADTETDEEWANRDNRETLDRIAVECHAAGFETPDGTVLALVRRVIESATKPPTPQPQSVEEARAKVKWAVKNLVREFDVDSYDIESVMDDADKLIAAVRSSTYAEIRAVVE